MLIEKEFELTLNDYLSLQRYNFNKNNNWWNSGNIASLGFSLFFIYFILSFPNLDLDNGKYLLAMGIILILFNIIRLGMERANGYKLYDNFFKNVYYKDFKNVYVKMKIDENGLLECCSDFERRITKKFVNNCVNIKDYIYLIDNRHNTIIIPKKFFSDEEQKIILNNFGGAQSRQDSI